MQPRRESCPECQLPELSRREFVSALSGAALAAGLGAALAPRAFGAPKADSPAEQAVKRLYDSLSEAQRGEICMKWDDPRRTKISANWHITKANIGGLTKDQQVLVTEILKGVTSPDGYDRFVRQMKDDHETVDNYAVAIAGTPGEGKSCFLLTGRHLTLRADGNTTENSAFGGPMIYGHGKGKPSENLFFYQTKRANEVFKALDEKQRKLALVARAPNESAVEIRGANPATPNPGIALAELSTDQRDLVKKVLADILSPYRKDDADEVLSIVEAAGWEKLNMAFYSAGDLEEDGVWDVWRLEGPTIVSHFRGSPHVHAYLNVAKV